MLTQISNLSFNIDIKKKLNQINKLERVNSGGCGIVAYSLAKYVEKKYPHKKVKIIYLFSNHDKISYKNIQKNKPDSSLHITVKIDSLYYDSTGIYTLDILKRKWKVTNTAIVSKKLTLKR